MLNTVLAIKRLWASGEDRCVLLGSRETEDLAPSKSEEETGWNMVAKWGFSKSSWSFKTVWNWVTHWGFSIPTSGSHWQWSSLRKRVYSWARHFRAVTKCSSQWGTQLWALGCRTSTWSLKSWAEGIWKLWQEYCNPLPLKACSNNAIGITQVILGNLKCLFKRVKKPHSILLSTRPCSM